MAKRIGDMSSKKSNTSKRIEDLFKKRKTNKSVKQVSRLKGPAPLANNRNRYSNISGYTSLKIRTNNTNSRGTIL